MSLQEKINSLHPFKDSLGENLIGIEKEGLRVAKDGTIAQTPHPTSFGSALTIQKLPLTLVRHWLK